jgi:phage baseplate assembly protein W
MPSISFTGLQKSVLTANSYIYSDLHLDLANPINKDLTLDYDEAAIKNSINSLFNTLPGQNLLNPEYGLNLAQYLFEPVSQSVGNRIGKDILRGIISYEPRVTVKNINIQLNPDEQTYYIELNIVMPYLNDSTIKIPGVLSRTGYTLS